MSMNLIFLIGRIIFGGYFLFNAFNHFRNADSMREYAESKNVPMPKMAVVGTGLLLLLGGAGIAFGVQPQIAILLLVLFLLPTTLIMHDFWNADDGSQMNEQINFMKNFALIGALLMLLALHALGAAWPLSL